MSGMEYMKKRVENGSLYKYEGNVNMNYNLPLKKTNGEKKPQTNK